MIYEFMSNDAERAETGKAVAEAIELAAGENVHAAAYLRLIAGCARLIDDLHDGDRGPVDVGQLAHLLLVSLPRNPFFAAHSSYLVALHDAAINAWQDANQMDPDNRLPHARVWSDFVNEIACVVAGLAGGYQHRRNVSPRIRALLYEGWDEMTETPELVETNE
jgi:hypothetical protein